MTSNHAVPVVFLVILVCSRGERRMRSEALITVNHAWPPLRWEDGKGERNMENTKLGIWLLVHQILKQLSGVCSALSLLPANGFVNSFRSHFSLGAMKVPVVMMRRTVSRRDQLMLRKNRLQVWSSVFFCYVIVLFCYVFTYFRYF